MGCIEFLIVLAMASLYFSIVPWCVGLDQLVPNIKLLQGFFKERWRGIFSANQPICELFWESLRIEKPSVFINEGVLVPLCRLFLPYNTDLGNKFHIDLHPLARIGHLFIGLWRTFLWIGQLYSH